MRVVGRKRAARAGVLRVTEGADGLSAAGRDQRIDGAEHAVQPVSGLATQALALSFDRVARPSVHGGQEQVVHVDDLIEQRLARFDEVACDERVALRFGEAAQIAGVVAASEFAELAHDPGIDVIQACAVPEQLLDQAQAYDVALDGRGIGGLRIVLELEQARTGIAVRHFDKQFDIGSQRLRQACGDGGEEVGRRVGHDGGNDALQRAGAGQQDLPAAQPALRAGQHLRRRPTFQGALAQPAA